MKTIFLDRDGIINKALVIGRKPYPPACINAVKLEEGIEELLEYLSKDYLLLVVTNQPDVARGIQTREEVESINAYLKTKLPMLTEFFVCYHDTEDKCNCRKPKPGLFEEANKKYDIDYSESWMIGDRSVDMIFGYNLGLKTIFVDYNYNEGKPWHSDYTVQSVDEIIRIFKEINKSEN